MPPPDNRASVPADQPADAAACRCQPLDIVLALGQRLKAAHAELSRANVLWLPTIYMGVDYFPSGWHHPGCMGNIVNANKPTSHGWSDAERRLRGDRCDLCSLLGPASGACRVLADLQASHNDSLLAVAEAYFNVQQARGELAGAMDSLRRTEMMVKRIDNLVEALSPAVEKNRALTELASRQQAVESAYERWQTAGAELSRLLRLDPTALVQPHRTAAPQRQRRSI